MSTDLKLSKAQISEDNTKGFTDSEDVYDDND